MALKLCWLCAGVVPKYFHVNKVKLKVKAMARSMSQSGKLIK